MYKDPWQAYGWSQGHGDIMEWERWAKYRTDTNVTLALVLNAFRH